MCKIGIYTKQAHFDEVEIVLVCLTFFQYIIPIILFVLFHSFDDITIMLKCEKCNNQEQAGVYIHVNKPTEHHMIIYNSMCMMIPDPVERDRWPCEQCGRCE